ncbi:MAG: DUF2231 domain-containing protein [Oscillochloridaceae bacterium]|nr:DUF2231 domain-containing protein [Chloroflexaceae bacterium]MDW8388796.1 DUF2231 domain-containing protein [Oscillochloridaceae bacterium]
MSALHPFTVHFPIALLLVSGLFTLIALRRGEAAWETSAYHCLLVGWIAGVVAALSGAFDAARQLIGPEAIRGLIGWVNAHAFVNIAALIVYGRALLLRRRRSDLLADATARRSYLRLHAIGALLLVVGGWLGGQLVYRFGLGVQL